MLATVLVLAAGVWLRVTSLGTMHFPDADEAWYGAQALELARGGRVATRTTAGNLLDPYYVGMEALLLAFREPSVALLRYPAAACGLLAIGLLYRLAARSLDRTTAVLAAGLMASLPAAIIFSRIGYYSAVTPLFCIIALDSAFRRRLPALVVAIVGGYLIHPTTLFFLPVPLAVLMTRPDPTTDDVAIDRRGVLAAAVTAVVAAAAGLVLVARVPQMRAMVGTEGGGPLRFLLEQQRYRAVGVPGPLRPVPAGDRDRHVPDRRAGPPALRPGGLGTAGAPRRARHRGAGPPSPLGPARPGPRDGGQPRRLLADGRQAVLPDGLHV